MLEELKGATLEDERRLEALRSIIYGLEGMLPTDTVRIYCYRDQWGGVRISEIGMSRKTATGVGGSSWMSSDRDCGDVIFRAERYLMACLCDVEDHGGGAVYDPEQEARRSLLYALSAGSSTDRIKAMGEWVERDHNPLSDKNITTF